jgi:hypothetical protein
MERRDIFVAIDQGRLDELVASSDSTKDLNEIHNALFHRALEVGVAKQELIRRIDQATYAAARDSLMDERDIKQMSRKTLEDYDPKLAIQVYRTQINAMYKEYLAARENQETGEERPEEELFNTNAYGQTLGTASLDGTPAVAVFTQLAVIEAEKIRFGRIGQDQTYKNLKENPKGIFTALGPSNDPSKIDLVSITVELEEDADSGEKLDRGRLEFGNAVSNLLIFKVLDVKINHLPKPAHMV